MRVTPKVMRLVAVAALALPPSCSLGVADPRRRRAGRRP